MSTIIFIIYMIIAVFAWRPLFRSTFKNRVIRNWGKDDVFAAMAWNVFRAILWPVCLPLALLMNLKDDGNDLAEAIAGRSREEKRRLRVEAAMKRARIAEEQERIAQERIRELERTLLDVTS